MPAAKAPAFSLPAPLGRPAVRSRQPASSPGSGSGSPGSGSVVAGSSIGFASAGFASRRRRTGALHQRPPADVTLYGAETVDVRRERTTNRRTAAGPLRCMAPHGPELSRTPEPDHSAAASAADLPSCHPPLPHPCRDNSEPQPDLHGQTPPLPDRAGTAVRHSWISRLGPTAASTRARQRCATAGSLRLGPTAASTRARQRCATAGSSRLDPTAASTRARQRCATAGSLRLGPVAV
jgi:hypothetical protein